MGWEIKGSGTENWLIILLLHKGSREWKGSRTGLETTRPVLSSSNTVPQQKGAATFPKINTTWVASVQTWEPKEGHFLFELQHSTLGPQRLGAIS